jgi:hypothetical protein
LKYLPDSLIKVDRKTRWRWRRRGEISYRVTLICLGSTGDRSNKDGEKQVDLRGFRWQNKQNSVIDYMCD